MIFLFTVFKKTTLAAKQRLEFRAGQHETKHGHQWEAAAKVCVQDAWDLGYSHSSGDKLK